MSNRKRHAPTCDGRHPAKARCNDRLRPVTREQAAALVPTTPPERRAYRIAETPVHPAILAAATGGPISVPSVRGIAGKMGPPVPPAREKLPDTRPGRVGTIRLGETRLYVVVGTYEDGRPGELFCHVRGDPTLGGMADALAIVVSIALQYGVPLAAITGKLRHQRFPPDGPTGDGSIASSPVDALAALLKRWFP